MDLVKPREIERVGEESEKEEGGREVFTTVCVRRRRGEDRAGC